jgi:hypothetical protein
VSTPIVDCEVANQRRDSGVTLLGTMQELKRLLRDRFAPSQIVSGDVLRLVRLARGPGGGAPSEETGHFQCGVGD